GAGHPGSVRRSRLRLRRRRAAHEISIVASDPGGEVRRGGGNTPGRVRSGGPTWAAVDLPGSPSRPPRGPGSLLPRSGRGGRAGTAGRSRLRAGVAVALGGDRGLGAGGIRPGG